MKKDSNAPSFKVPDLEVIKEYKPKHSPIVFIDGDRKKPSGPKEKKPPSKYMLEIIRRNFVELIHKYDKLQAKKRAEAMGVTKRNIQMKFLKVLKNYRRYKERKDLDEYGDTVGQLPPKKRVKLGYHDDPDIKENEFHIKVLNDDLNDFFKDAGDSELLNKHNKLLKK